MALDLALFRLHQRSMFFQGQVYNSHLHLHMLIRGVFFCSLCLWLWCLSFCSTCIASHALYIHTTGFVFQCNHFIILQAKSDEISDSRASSDCAQPCFTLPYTWYRTLCGVSYLSVSRCVLFSAPVRILCITYPHYNFQCNFSTQFPSNYHVLQTLPAPALPGGRGRQHVALALHLC